MDKIPINMDNMEIPSQLASLTPQPKFDGYKGIIEYVHDLKPKQAAPLTTSQMEAQVRATRDGQLRQCFEGGKRSPMPNANLPPVDGTKLSAAEVESRGRARTNANLRSLYR